MARELVSSSSQWFKATSCPITGVPFTAAIRFVMGDDAAGNLGMLQLCNNADDEGHRLWRMGDSDTYFQYQCRDSGGVSANNGTANPLVAGTLYSVAIVGRSATDREIYENGVSASTSVTSRTPTNFNRIVIGARSEFDSEDRPLDGVVAEFALWDADIGVANLLAFHKGASALLLAPSALVCYVPFLEASGNARDIVGGLTFTATNAPGAFAHPRTFYPHGTKVRHQAAAAAPATTVGCLTQGGLVHPRLTRGRLVA